MTPEYIARPEGIDYREHLKIIGSEPVHGLRDNEVLFVYVAS